MKYYIIAGEKSGDQHGAGLVRALYKIDSNAIIKGVGGDAMHSMGVSLLFHLREIAVMGFVDVFLRLFQLNRLIRQCKNDLVTYDPDVVILIDSAGFNLRMAKFARKQGFKVYYFIPPKVWAWGLWRVKALRRNVNHIFVTLPFEEPFFKKLGIDTTYAGSPVREHLDSLIVREKISRQGDSQLVALLPGSRQQEVRKHLEVMLGVAVQFKELEFMVCAVNTVSKGEYERLPLPDNVVISYDSSCLGLMHFVAAIVVSGTATLETCLLQIPQVVVYKTGVINYLLARIFISVKYISLVNLIAGDNVVKELIQQDYNKDQIAAELGQLINNHDYRRRMIDSYEQINKQLTGSGTYLKIAGKIKGLCSL